jgi:hypothetical protein
MNNYWIEQIEQNEEVSERLEAAYRKFEAKPEPKPEPEAAPTNWWGEPSRNGTVPAITDVWQTRNNGLPEIDVVVRSDELNRPRRLKARWSLEAEQDLRAMHNVEAESELSRILSTELMREIDAAIIEDLRIQALAQNYLNEREALYGTAI